MSFERIIIQIDLLRSKGLQTFLSLSRAPLLAAPTIPNAAWGHSFFSAPLKPRKDRGAVQSREPGGVITS